MKYLSRFKNTGTVMAILGLILGVLATNGIPIDNDKVTYTVQAVCGILVILGIMNNPTTKGVDLPNNEDK